jgi:glutathione S-transferase
MPDYELVYFDFSGSRGEECRLALFVAGVDFVDHRLASGEWAALKPKTPFGSLPVLKVAGKPTLSQSNAILTYVGRLHGLHPADAWEAACHEALMASAEELRSAASRTNELKDNSEKRLAREAFADGPLRAWSQQVQDQVKGPFVGGQHLSVVDIKIYMVMRAYKQGVLDFIPSTVFDAFPRLSALYAAVDAHPKIAQWRVQH